MKRIMMAGALGLVMALLYLYARSGVICTGNSSDAPANRTDTVLPQKEEIEKDICGEQFSVQETLDGYEIILYDKEGEKVYSEVYPWKQRRILADKKSRRDNSRGYSPCN